MSAAPAGELCVAHLVRIGEPVASLRRFLASYEQHPAGAPHDLVILYKGFQSKAALAPYRAAAVEVPHGELRLGDEGFDLTAYRAAAEMLRARRYCFLNSHSRILADGWLDLMLRALDHAGVGLVGATGSWASRHSLARYLARLPSAYSAVLPDRGTSLAAFAAVERSLEPGEPQTDELRGAQAEPHIWIRRLQALRGIPEIYRILRAFGGFPAPHLRTNAFVVEHDLWTDLPPISLTSKLDAHALESGRRGLTRQIEDRGLSVLVADRFGAAYRPSDWARSETFWQGSQAGLMVADNQTEAYARADMERRTLLARVAWGALAAPSDPAESRA